MHSVLVQQRQGSWKLWEILADEETPLQEDESRVLLLPPGARARIQSAFGAIWLSIGGGFTCATTTFSAWLEPNRWVTLDADQETEIEVPGKRGSWVIGVLPGGSELERVGLVIRGANQMKSLLPMMDSGMPASAIPAWENIDAWRHGPEGLIEVSRWASGLMDKCADVQRELLTRLPRCAGRTTRQKQSILCRLLRARIALKHMHWPSIEQGASVASMSPWRFISVHKQVFGETPAKFASACRLESAYDRLTQTDFSVNEIADSIGYRNRTSFWRAFKARFGTSPNEIRRQ